MIIELEGGIVESEFPLTEASGLSENNNAVVVEQNVNTKGKGGEGKGKSSRADRFRSMVNDASKEMDMDGVEQLNESQISRSTRSGCDPSRSFEEGETHSSDDDATDDVSGTSSVKILPHTKEQIEKEEEEFRKERDLFINQAVDKTLKKLTDFMKESGIIFHQAEMGNKKGGQDKGERSTQKEGQVWKTSKGGEIAILNCNSSSATTIYENAVRQNSDTIPNNLNNRVSTSSEEIGDTSDELENTDLMSNLI